MALKTVKLKYPFKFGESKEVTEVNFSRRPQGKDFKGMPASMGHSEQMVMISRLSDITVAELEKMDASDYVECCAALASFLDRGEEKEESKAGDSSSEG